ncbi:Eukaryotic peptide chain release factor GTP-binding subunit [Coemansia erecta]|uniref:Palmitoyltransferase n=1 Tax=Coemansia asiatica TaxID=1052880 RepID=A0A9W7XMK8_9FUNG|nr:Eukaryotic peptide chain release factor GTP-binding subunit [Coemansia asiatica]KAJ2852870.1 Eukaryotic peptide chain release factor GTP-binding subunit [Coemansia erecta]
MSASSPLTSPSAQPRPRPTIVQLSPVPTNTSERRFSGPPLAAVQGGSLEIPEKQQQQENRYTPRTLIETAKSAYDKKRASQELPSLEVNINSSGQKHFSHDYPPRDSAASKFSPPLKPAQTQQKPVSPISRQSTTSPTATSFAAKEQQPAMQSGSSIQFLGPERTTIMRMSVNEDIPAVMVTREAGPHSRTNSNGTDATASNAFPSPVGLYSPVDEKTYQRHPDRYTNINGRRLKVPIYKLYSHGNWHLFKGRVMTGSQPAPFMLALVMLTAPIVVFSVFVCPYLWSEVSKAAVIVFIYLVALTYASMMMASFTDPGIIPRNLDAITPPDDYVVAVNSSGNANPGTSQQQNQQNQQQQRPRSKSMPNEASSRTAAERDAEKSRLLNKKQISKLPLQYHMKLPPPWVPVGTSSDHGHSATVFNRPASSDRLYMYAPTTKLVTINNNQVRLKYCETCKIYRPPRASHCRYCDNCVENEDHHCIWLNNCIGRRNYRYFYSFLLATNLLALYIIAFSIVRLVLPLHRPEDPHDYHTSFGESVRHHPLVMALILYVLINITMVGGLFMYHTVLISRNITTHEVLGAKHSQVQYDEEGREMRSRRPMLFAAQTPYSTGSCLSNWAVALCNPAAPTNVRWRARVDPEGIEELATARV